MPPSRFGQVSPFKNVQANIAKREQWFTEIPVTSSSIAESSDGIKATDEFAVARGSSQGTLIFLPFSNPGKHAQKAPTFQASGRAIADFDTSFVEPLIASASDDGRISISTLPSIEKLQDSSAGHTLSLTNKTSFSAPLQKTIEVVKFHPSTSGLLLSNQGSNIQVWDFENGKQEAVFAAKGQERGHWSVNWSYDGRSIQTAAKDNTVNLWDIRQSSEKPIATAAAHKGFNKPMRITSVNDLIFTTGFSKMRDRECAIWDPRNLDKPIKKQILDTNTGVLIPLVDQSRKMIYLVGRSDMTIRWAEIQGDSSLTIGNAPLPVPSQGAALVPQTSKSLDVMQAEVQKLVLLGQEAVVPVTIQVPRRSYLDFHAELFLPTQEYQSPSQNAASWTDGQDTPPAIIMPKPGQVWGGAIATQTTQVSKPAPAPTQAKQATPEAVQRAMSQTAASTSAVVDSSPAAVKSSVSANAPTEEVKNLRMSDSNGAAKRQEMQSKPSASSGADTNANVATVTSNSTAAKPPPSAVNAPVAKSAPSAPPTGPAHKLPTHWSRSFLAGKTPLKPDYEDVHNINSTISASVQLLKANTKYFFYPLAGPGGRLAYHSLAQKGRLPVQIPCIASGHDIVDFALDPFNEKKVYIAGNDGRIRVFEVPEGADSGEHTQTVAVIEDSMDKLLELAPHPSLKHVLLSASEDHGNPAVRLWDVSAEKVLAKVAVPGKGIHSVAWDHLGNRIAVTCKDKKLRILDPRQASAEVAATGNMHESLRPSKVVWVNLDYIITSGFSRTASREIQLHKLGADGKTLEIVSKATIDVSPAPLFPHYDEDTSILYVFAKGERTCHAYEITNLQGDSKDKAGFNKLPSFEHGSLQLSLAFLPKQTVDVKAVEVANAYRLTSNTVQHIRFSIPRAKMDYFQDDVYPNCTTRDTMMPDESLTIEEWMNGKDAQQRFVNLRPEGMPLLSEAPPPGPRVKQQLMAKQMTEEESQQAYLDSLFKHKQAEVDSDEDEQRIKQRDLDDDDDW